MRKSLRVAIAVSLLVSTPARAGASAAQAIADADEALKLCNSARGPVIPQCSAAQRDDPRALCSNGVINVPQAADRQTFVKILQTFGEQMPLPEPPDLIRYWEYLYERSIGCVGILKDWLVKGLSVAIRQAASRSVGALTQPS